MRNRPQINTVTIIFFNRQAAREVSSLFNWPHFDIFGTGDLTKENGRIKSDKF